jgi:hypothetical protein
LARGPSPHAERRSGPTSREARPALQGKLAEAQKAQADILRQQRELEDAKREVALTVERQVQASLTTIRDKAKAEAEETVGLRVREKEEQIAGMTRQIEELKRKAEQGSQQLQGEVQELVLEEMLRQRFPHDTIEPVGKGEYGGDVIQRVFTAAGQPCGSILWESKRTKTWSDAWLTKLRTDQRTAKADVALIISRALPKGLAHFEMIDGVWVADSKCAMAVASAIRDTLIQVAGARSATEGQRTKMAMVYEYLVSPAFRHRVEAIVEKSGEMQADLDRERKAMTKMRSKRLLNVGGTACAPTRAARIVDIRARL